jgi:molecular chaperone GrpE
MPTSPESEVRAETEAEAAQGDEVGELREQNAQLEDRYKRTLAALENYRKRSAREVEARVAEQSERMVLEWLDAVDNVERALEMGDPEDSLFAGVRAVLEQMEAALERQGLTRVGAAGERFDPAYHEAIATVDHGDDPDGTIADVARSGWARGETVVRPARVTVARGRPDGEA